LVAKTCEQGIHLVICEGHQEIDCRKIRVSQLEGFLDMTDGSLFKRNFQLHNRHGRIILELHRKAVGEVSKGFFQRIIDLRRIGTLKEEYFERIGSAKSLPPGR